MKILFAAMKLGIGGAETHIVGLAEYLAATGHEIIVASAGGVYEKRLSAAGIRHVTLPLDTKKPVSVIRAYTGLKRLINDEHFDVVHAHARIPAFICSLLQKKLGFRFVTTAHLDFKTGIMQKKFSRWGEKTLAVSCDIKDYLIREYGIFPDNISVTVNGIDTSYFTPRRKSGAGRITILCVSRIDRDRSLAAFLLAEAAAEICGKYPDALFTIVGGGGDFGRLKAKVENINTRAGKELVRLTGEKSDVLPYIKEADLFIGVSRAALEAMSCGVPVILAGNQGYLGIFDKAKLDKAINTNLCCRGEPLPSSNDIRRDILRFLGMSGAERIALGGLCRETVLERYTFKKTAQDCLAVYSSLPKKAAQMSGGIVICGYFGFGNAGDEAILAEEIKQLRLNYPGKAITVLSASPSSTSADYGVCSVGRYDLLGVIKAIRGCSVFILGGGGLIQDSTSRRSALYYCGLVRLAHKFRKKIIISANGLGPLRHKITRRAAADAFACADEISLRDKASEALLRSLGVKNKTALVPDPALGIITAPPERIKYLKFREGLSGKKYFIISMRSTDKTDKNFLRSICDACRTIQTEYGLVPVILMLYPRADRKISTAAQRLIPGAAVPLSLSPSEMTGLIGGAELLIGMRLHSLIFAKASDTPFFALSYDAKVAEFAKNHGAAGITDISADSGERLLADVRKFIKQIRKSH